MIISKNRAQWNLTSGEILDLSIWIIMYILSLIMEINPNERGK